MKKLILTLALLLAIQPLTASASLWNYYSSLGQSLPTLSERAVLYAELSDDKYVGSVAQNNLLESELRAGSFGEGFGAVTPQPRLLGDNTWTGTNTFSGTTILNNYRQYVAGENISSTKAVYLKESDNKIYLTTSTDEGIYKFIGFASSDILSGSTGSIQISGTISISGLEAGSNYYATSSGAISTSTSILNRIVRAGYAISSTTLQIKNDSRKRIIVGNETQATTTSIGFKANKATINWGSGSTIGGSGGGSAFTVRQGTGYAYSDGTNYTTVMLYGGGCSAYNEHYTATIAKAIQLYTIGTTGSCFSQLNDAGSMSLGNWTTSTVDFIKTGSPTYTFIATFEE
jgi:hypothetical protein